MGRNKALLEIQGLPILERVAGVLHRVCSEVIIAGGDNQYPGCADCRTVPDIYPGYGPISGLHAGLSAAANSYSFVCACDLPFADEGLIKRIIAEREGYDVIMLKVGEYLEPLFSLYSEAFIPAAEISIKNGVYKVTDSLSRVMWKPLAVEPSAVPGLRRSLMNINTPYDYEEAKKIRD